MTNTATPLRSKTRGGELEIDPRFQNRERQPGLDLLRALAIIVVMVYHAALFGFKLPGRVDRFGWIGVDLFFVLSVSLIGRQLLAPLARDRRINLGRDELLSLGGRDHPQRLHPSPPLLYIATLNGLDQMIWRKSRFSRRRRYALRHFAFLPVCGES